MKSNSLTDQVENINEDKEIELSSGEELAHLSLRPWFQQAFI